MDDGVLQQSSSVGVKVRSALPGRFRLWVPGLYRNDELRRTLEHGLNGSTGRKVSTNVIAATVLVLTPNDAAAEALVEEVEALVERFASESTVTLDQLARRGRKNRLI